MEFISFYTQTSSSSSPHVTESQKQAIKCYSRVRIAGRGPCTRGRGGGGAVVGAGCVRKRQSAFPARGPRHSLRPPPSRRGPLAPAGSARAPPAAAPWRTGRWPPHPLAPWACLGPVPPAGRGEARGRRVRLRRLPTSLPGREGGGESDS